MTSNSSAERKITIILGSMDRGGCEIHLFKVLPLLKSKGFAPTIYSISHKGELDDELTQLGVPVIAPVKKRGTLLFLRQLQLLSSAIGLWWHLVRNKVKVVHCFLPASYLIGGPVALLAGTRNRLMSRRSLNDYQKSKPSIIARIEYLLHKRMTVLLGNSKHVVEQLINDEKADPKRTLLLYNGIIVREKRGSRKNIRDKNRIPQESLVFACVANLIPYKGHFDLIEAFGHVKLQLPENWRLLLIGRDDGIGGALMQRVEELGLTEHIVFLGSRSDVSDLLDMSDIAVLASHEEGFSNAVLEGMEAGLPMIVTDVGGNSEAVIDHKTGFVVPPKCPEKLAGAIIKLAADPELRESMGRSGHNRIKHNFNIEDCVRRYSELYTVLFDGGNVEDVITRHLNEYNNSI